MNSKMKYARIAGVEKKVSRIWLGTASIPKENPNVWLDAMLETGVTTFDSARTYLNSETLGKWMTARGNREDVVILTKCCHPNLILDRVNAKAMRKDIALSLNKLQTNYIDIYLLHRDNPKTDVGEIVETFNDMYAKGQVKAFGGSNWTHERIQEANEYADKHNLIPFTVSSPNFGLANQIGDPWGGGCVSISGPRQSMAREWYQKNQMPVAAYSSLGRGLFSGRVKSNDTVNVKKYMDMFARKGYAYPDNFERLRRCEELAEKKGCTVPQIAMAWIFTQKMNMFAVVSTSKASRMLDNIAAMTLELTEAEAKYLNLELGHL